jgi:hypothetical protein
MEVSGNNNTTCGARRRHLPGHLSTILIPSLDTENGKHDRIFSAMSGSSAVGLSGTAAVDVCQARYLLLAETAEPLILIGWTASRL